MLRRQLKLGALCASCAALLWLVLSSPTVALAEATASPSPSALATPAHAPAGSTTSVRILVVVLLLGAAFLTLLRRRQGTGRR
ncbi:MAG: hypothetical protein JOZ89_09815 [Gammaproteobacteria bacterium]|nr:hypothetical protein [Gammaproteobacteria bacterium]